MNIFILDLDPEKAAQYHCDKHVIKMIIESAQLLCSVHHFYYQDLENIPYKKSHINHPCSKWVRESLSNYKWLNSLGLFLCKEYYLRYGNKTHKTLNVLIWCIENQPLIYDKGLTPFAQAMPEQYKNEDPVKAYRDYYLNEKKNICKWSNQIPEWWII